MSTIPFAAPVEVVWTATTQGASAVPATPLQVAVAQIQLGLKGNTGDIHPSMPGLVIQATAAAQAAAESAELIDLGALGQAVSDAQDAKSGAEDAASLATDKANIASEAASEVAGIVATLLVKHPHGAALPISDIGPIWHDDYASVMTWRTIGAYTGYASTNLGEVSYFEAAAAPIGWLKSAGQTLTASYEALNQYRGSAILKDLRGEFIRGFDDGRGVDAGRALGSAQFDGIKAHTHVVKSLDSINQGTTGGLSGYSYTPTSTNNGLSAITAAQFTGSISETRPRSIAMLACIKY